MLVFYTKIVPVLLILCHMTVPLSEIASFRISHWS